MIIVIAGPTGVGKTKLSIELAKKYNAEIINADSVQVYKKIDIASAKVTEEEKEGIPHHLFDIKEYDEDYTVYDYQIDARRVLNKLLKENKNVIIVGGTGLYIKALLYDYRFNKEEDSHKYDNLTNAELLDKIYKINPNSVVDKNNNRRIVRELINLENGAENKTAIIVDLEGMKKEFKKTGILKTEIIYHENKDSVIMLKELLAKGYKINVKNLNPSFIIKENFTFVKIVLN